MQQRPMPYTAACAWLGERLPPLEGPAAMLRRGGWVPQRSVHTTMRTIRSKESLPMSEAPTRSILITGCSSGIGRTTAFLLRERGWRVFASARKEADVEDLGQHGFEALRLDHADSQSQRDAVEWVLERTGGSLDALFNNGAFGQPGAVEDLSREVMRFQFETNFFGWHELTCLVLPVMRRQGHGRILYNSSVLGFVAFKYRGAYAASKYAVEGMVDTLRHELAGTRIHPVLIEPGPILTRFRDNAIELYRRNVDPQHSPHRDAYLQQEARLSKKGAAAPFTLPPEAVAGKVLRALEARHPRARYYVTFPTYLLAYLKRVLPTEALDWVLTRSA